MGDPLAEKYLNISPFIYTLNNPIGYIDPDGMKVKDPYKIVENYKNGINAKKAGLKTCIDNSLMDSSLGSKLMSFYNNALNEVAALENSEQVYTISLDNNASKERGITYDLKSNEISVSVGDSWNKIL